MDQTIKSQWVAALRSGDYKQTECVLREGNRYCCLGVLCDLHSKAHPGDQHSWRQTSGQERCYFYGDQQYELLPDNVQRWAGLHSDNPDLVVDGKMRTLAALNDTGSTFEQIAQLIEEQL